MQYFGEASPEFIRHHNIGQRTGFPFGRFPLGGSFFYFGHFVAGCWLLVVGCWSISTGGLLAALAHVNLNLKLIGLPGRWPLVVAFFYFFFVHFLVIS